MKTLKIFTILSLVTIVTTTSFAQNTERTLVKSFNLKGKDMVMMNVNGDVEVKEWNQDIMRIEVSINLTNGTSSMLKSLIRAKRYNLTSVVNGDALEIQMPSLKRKVKVSGKELTEKITYTVFAPADVQVKLSDETSASNVIDVKNSTPL
ncbi:MAG TPA: hypothetical protein ENJ53_10005 [Phaeodactylibacter sp.]|nr:hypothetical protein [Phaeodactylibacter sp.]